jgi:hypothetical protein
MTKTKKFVKPSKQKESFLSKFNLEDYLPQKYHLLAVILVIFILFLAFLSPMYFDGKTFQSGDIITSESMKPYVLQDKESFSLWNPLIFLGMPAYSLGTEQTWFNLIYMGFSLIRKVFNSFFSVEYATWSFYLILLAITSFIFMKYITKNTLVSLFTAVATSFSTGIMVLLYIGHVTKLTSLCMYPLLFLILFRFQEKIKIIDILLLIIILQLFVQGFHVQIIFYTLFAVGIYFVFYFIRAQVKKEILKRNNLLKSALIFAASVIIALLISADNFTQIYEYTPFSTRGGTSIGEKQSKVEDPASSDYYEYHTNWSFSPGEVLTFIIPSYYGFGNSKYNGPLSQGQEIEVNTYFGQMPFVDVAMYMGVIVFFLGLFAVITRWKDPLVQFLSILSGISLLVSFGKTFPVLFDLMFYYFPFFDKFRVPSMILVLVQLSLPVLAGIGLMKILSLRQEPDQRALNILKFGAYIFSGIFILALVLNQSLVSWFTARVNEYAASIQVSRPQYAQQFQALAEYMSQMFSGDFLLAFGFLAAAFWLCNFYVKNRLSFDVLVLVIILLTTIDLWRIDSRGAKFVDNPEIKGMFIKPDYVSAIQQQKDKEPFRLINLKQDGSLGSLSQNSNYNAYFLLEDFYGYSGIKPRAYQDIIDIVGPVNETIWRMANVKYVILEKATMFPGLIPIYTGEKSTVMKNENALPRFYFVNNVETKKNLEVLEAIKSNSFDPKETAYLHEGSLKVDKPDSTTFIKVEKYSDEKSILNVYASGNNFMFIGCTFFSGKADYKLFKLPTGWRAYIDGKETQIYQTNHAFMGIVVPKGKHNIEIEFAPVSFTISKYLSFLLSLIILFGLLISLSIQFFNTKKVNSKN